MPTPCFFPSSPSKPRATITSPFALTLLHRQLSRLGRHLFLWQPLLRFSHFVFYSRPCRFLPSCCSAFSFPRRCSRRRLHSSRRLHSLERRPYLSMGFPSDSRARTRFFFGNNPQSIFRRARPACGRSACLHV